MKRSPLRPVSPKRRAALPKRAEVRDIVLDRDNWSCQFMNALAASVPTGKTPDLADVPLACGGPLDVHEIIPRSADPTAWLRPEACKTLCRRHHDWVGDHPALAHEIGLHGFSWERVALADGEDLL